DHSLAELDLIGPEQRHAVIEQWNATHEPFPALAVHELVARHAHAVPGSVAASTPGGANAVTYEALDRRATALAHRLVAMGAAPESMVGIHLTSTPDLLVAIVAIWKAGAAYVPLDPAQPAARLHHI